MKKALFILLLLALVLLSACGEPEAETDPTVIDHQQFLSETVYIGSVLPLTGADSERAALLQAAQQTAAEVINGAWDDVDWDMAKNPGIAGYGGAWVELVCADCGVEEAQIAEQPAQQAASQAAVAQPAANTQAAANTQPAQQTASPAAVTPAELQQLEDDAAAAAAQDLIDQGVVALIGAYRSGPTAAAATVAAEAGRPLITGTASLDSLTEDESYDFGLWFNRIAPTVDMHNRLFFSYVKHLNQTQQAGITKVALAYKDDYFGREVLESFNEEAAALGLQVVARIAYKDETDDLATAAARMMANGPEAVFHYGDPADLSAFARYYGGAKFAPRAAFCYDVSFQDPDFRLAVTEAKAGYWYGLSATLTRDEEEEGTITSDASDLIRGDSDIFYFINGIYSRKTGLDMDNEALYDFAAVMLIAQAAAEAGTTEPEQLAAALREGDFDAPYLAAGHISFSDLGQNEVSAGFLTNLTENGEELAFQP